MNVSKITVPETNIALKIGRLPPKRKPNHLPTIHFQVRFRLKGFRKGKVTTTRCNPSRRWCNPSRRWCKPSRRWCKPSRRWWLRTPSLEDSWKYLKIRFYRYFRLVVATQIFFIFNPIWGRFPIWLIFFRWVETTNQFDYFDPFLQPLIWSFGSCPQKKSKSKRLKIHQTLNLSSVLTMILMVAALGCSLGLDKHWMIIATWTAKDRANFWVYSGFFAIL